jgi:hypothetical protein
MLTVGRKAKLQDEINKSIGETAEDLAQILGWDAKAKAQFSRALNREATDTMQKTAKDFGIDYHAGAPSAVFGDSYLPFAGKVVGNLSKISFIDVIRKEGLATSAQLQALEQFQILQAVADKLQSAEVTPPELKKTVTGGEGNTNLDGSPVTLQGRIDDIVRLHKLLEKVKKSLPENSPSAKAAAELSSRTAQAIETLKKLCRVGG